MRWFFRYVITGIWRGKPSPASEPGKPVSAYPFCGLYGLWHPGLYFEPATPGFRLCIMLSLCSGYPSAGLDMGAWRDDRLLRNRQDTFVSCHVVARMRNVLRTCSLLAMGLRDIDFLPVPSLFLFYHALCPSKGTAGLKIILSKYYRLRELGI